MENAVVTPNVTAVHRPHPRCGVRVQLGAGPGKQKQVNVLRIPGLDQVGVRHQNATVFRVLSVSAWQVVALGASPGANWRLCRFSSP